MSGAIFDSGFATALRGAIEMRVPAGVVCRRREQQSALSI
jgi:hypothetical protein